jgi:hypothetical protein
VGGFALEIEAPGQTDLRLLPQMVAMGNLPPLTAILGMSESGQPLTYSPTQAGFDRLIVTGEEGSGKSELLRTLLVSLTLTSRPSQIQIMGIDLSGRELTFLEGLPHALTDVACAAEYASELIDWLEVEMERRLRSGGEQPALLLVVDGFDELPGQLRRRVGRIMRRLAQTPPPGLHVVISGSETGFAMDGFSHADERQCWVTLGKTNGSCHIRLGDERHLATVAWLPARDLAAAVELIQCRPGGAGSGRLRDHLAREAA